MGGEVEVLTLACSVPPTPRDVGDKRVPACGRVWALGEGGDCHCGPEGLDWRGTEENIGWGKAA